MTRRIPLVPTLVVLMAVGAMVALGVWQLGRLHEKEALIAAFARNIAATQITDIARIDPERSAYRRVRLNCDNPADWRAVAGRSAAGSSGLVHRYNCGVLAGSDRTGTRYALLLTGEVGWSKDPLAPAFDGGTIVGRMVPAKNGIRIVSEKGMGGLEAAAQPDPRNVPNNHLSYAVQWFFFAFTALVIYALALRKRWAVPSPP